MHPASSSCLRDSKRGFNVVVSSISWGTISWIEWIETEIPNHLNRY